MPRQRCWLMMILWLMLSRDDTTNESMLDAAAATRESACHAPLALVAMLPCRCLRRYFSLISPRSRLPCLCHAPLLPLLIEMPAIISLLPHLPLLMPLIARLR